MTDNVTRTPTADIVARLGEIDTLRKAAMKEWKLEEEKLHSVLEGRLPVQDNPKHFTHKWEGEAFTVALSVFPESRFDAKEARKLLEAYDFPVPMIYRQGSRWAVRPVAKVDTAALVETVK